MKAKTPPSLVLLRGSTLMAALAAGLAVSQAQSSTPVTAGPAAVAPDATEEEIVILSPFEVTADDSRYGATLSMSGSRQAMALKELPRAISIITNELIEDTSSLNILDSIRFSSGITISEDNSTPSGDFALGNVGGDLSGRIRIRGYSISTVYRNFNPTEYTPWGPLIERIEVVKGPASALYGRAAPGGTVNYITKRPRGVESTSLSVSVGVEGDPTLLRAIVDHENMLLSDKLSYRLVAAYQDSDGIKDFSPDDHRNLLVSVKYEPTKQDTFIAEYEYADEESLAAASVYFRSRLDHTAADQAPHRHLEDRLFNPRLRTDFSKVESNKLVAEYRRRLFEGWDAQVNYEYAERGVDAQFTQFEGLRTGSANYHSGTPYNPEGASGNKENFLLGYAKRQDDRSSDAANLTLVGKIDFLGTENNFVTGGSYYSAQADILSHAASRQETRPVRIGCPPKCPPGFVNVVVTTPLYLPLKTTDIYSYDFPVLVDTAADNGGLYNTNRQEIGKDGLPDYLWRLGQESTTDFENVAFYAMNTTKLWKSGKGDFWRLHVMYGARYDDIGQNSTFTRILRNTATFEEEQIPVVSDDSDSAWTYQGSIMFNLFPDLAIYYAQSTSFVQQFSTVRERNQDPVFSKPAGPLLGDGKEVGLKFGLFRGKITGTLVAFEAEEENRVGNVGEDRYGPFQQTTKLQRSKGGEIDLLFTPWENWQTIVAVTYLDTEVAFLDLNDPLGYRFNWPPNTPAWQARAFSNYRFTRGPVKGLALGMGVDWMDDKRTTEETAFFGHPGTKHRAHLVGYTAFDLMLGYTWKAGDAEYSLRYNMKNVTDERYFVGGDVWANPRNSEITFKVSF